MATSRETVDALLRGKKAERVAVMGAPWADTVAAWVEQGYPTRMAYKEVGDTRWNREDGRQVDVNVAGEYEEPVPTWEHFGYDMVGVGPWFDIMPLRGHEELVQETDAPEDAQEKGGRPRFYRLTPKGRERLAEEARRLASYVEAARAKNLLQGSDA